MVHASHTLPSAVTVPAQTTTSKVTAKTTTKTTAITTTASLSTTTVNGVTSVIAPTTAALGSSSESDFGFT